MLHLIPAPLHRFALRWAFRLRSRFRRFARPDLHGVSVVPFDGEGRVLLARHSYGPVGWALLGGGMSASEEPAEAARRELREELDCELIDLALVETLQETISGSPHTAYVFTARLAGPPRADGREIEEVRYFAASELREETLTRVTRRRLEYLGVI